MNAFLSILLFLAIAVAIVKRPIVAYALMVLAGAFKADPRVAPVAEFIDITLLFALITFLVIAFNIVTQRVELLPERKFWLPILLFSLLIVLSLAFTSAPINGTDKVLRFFVFTLVSLVGPLYLVRDRRDIVFVYGTFTILSIAMVSEVVIHGSASSQFLQAFGSNYLIFSRIAGIALLSVLFYFTLHGNRGFRFLSLLCVVLLAYGLFTAGSRGPVLAFVLSVLISLTVLFLRHYRIVYLSINNPTRELSLKRLRLLLIAAGSGVVASFFMFYEVFETTAKRFMLLAEGGGESALERVEMFRSVLDILNSKASLFGLGIGAFAVYYNGEDVVHGVYPHNLFLEVWTELGILALGLMLVIILRPLFRQFRSIVERRDKLDTLAILILTHMSYMLANAMVSGNLNDNRYLFSAIGLAMAYQMIQNRLREGNSG